MTVNRWLRSPQTEKFGHICAIILYMVIHNSNYPSQWNLAKRIDPGPSGLTLSCQIWPPIGKEGHSCRIWTTLWHIISFCLAVVTYDIWPLSTRAGCWRPFIFQHLVNICDTLVVFTPHGQRCMLIKVKFGIEKQVSFLVVCLILHPFCWLCINLGSLTNYRS